MENSTVKASFTFLTLFFWAPFAPSEASPLIPDVDLLEGEPSLADVLMIDELTGELKKPGGEHK